MPQGKGTYGSKVGRPPKKEKYMGGGHSMLSRYDDGGNVEKKENLEKILQAGEDSTDKAIVEIMKYIPGSEGPPKGLVDLLEPVLRKAGEIYRKNKKEDKKDKEIKKEKNDSMLSRYDNGGEVSERYANMNVDQYRAELLEREIESATFGAQSDEEVATGMQMAQKAIDNMSDEAVEEKLVQERQNEMDANMDIGEQNYYRNKKEGMMSGGMMQYAEGGSMLVPPEMETPVDTYSNIPEDEMAEAKASQLPDDEMEDKYLEYVLDQSLDQNDQEYLMNALDGDERLSGIFDKVMDVAGEFSGEGEVEGLGTGVSDSIPARLSDGEFVFTKKATDQLGADKLQIMMDDAERAYDGGYMKKAFGGLTDSGTSEIEEEDEESVIRARMISADSMPSNKRR